MNGGWEAPTAGQLFNKAGHKTHAAAIMIFKKRTRRSGLFGLHISSSLRCLCGGGCWPSATFFRTARGLSPRCFDTFRNRQVTPGLPSPPKMKRIEKGGGKMRVHLGASFSTMTHAQLRVGGSVALPVS